MPPKVLVIDNYDSFTYNLVQYLGEIGADVKVIRNDEFPSSELEDFLKAENITHILISPGPGKPKDSKLSIESIKLLAAKIPILGVCLGHQAIGEALGAAVVKAPYLMHGKTSVIEHNETSPLFKDIPKHFTATRYHSLIIDRNSLEDSRIEVIAETNDELVMAVTHKDFKNLFGVQYHPESILSEYGHQLLKNFLSMVIV